MASNIDNNNPSPKLSPQDHAFEGIASLIKLLPTGTVFMYQFLSPVLSNYGECHTANKYVMGALLIICAFNCAITTLTDSYIDDDGKIQYGIATRKGLWRSTNSGATNVDWSSYKLRFKDFVHAVLGVVVFAVVAVLDSNTVNCYTSSWENNRKTMLMVLPPVVGAACSYVFAVFPCTRQGIGYPPTKNSTTTNS